MNPPTTTPPPEDEPQNDRPQPINISGDTITKSTADLPEEQRLLVRWAFNFAKENGLSWKEAARVFGCSTTTLFRVWQDRYRNPNTGERVSLDNLCASLSRAKRLADARGGVGKMPFIETGTYRKIEHLADEVLATNTIGFLFGESQLGKTRSIEEYARRHNHGQTLLVTCPPSAGVQLLTSEVGRALHIGRSSFDKMFLRVCEALDESRLLILDEAHMLFETYQKTSVARCLATIRQIHDRSGCGLLIVATNVFLTEAKNSEFRNTMKQFFRRGTLVLNLGTEPAWADVLAILAHYHLPEPQGTAMATLQTLAKQDGLGKVTKYLHGAARMAAKKKQPLGWNHFERYVRIIESMASGAGEDGR